MPPLRTAAFMLGVACAMFLDAAPAPGGQTAYTQDMDRSIKPGDDFYAYANGGWIRTAVIPPGQASYDTRAMLVEKTSQRVSSLIQEAATARSDSNSLVQKVGAYYASFMDQQSIEARGFAPIADRMAMIAAITTKASLSAYLGSTLNTEVDGLVTNSDHVFGMWVNQGFQDSSHYLPHLLQGGLGMPDLEDYLDPSPRMMKLRGQYQAHLAAMLKLASLSDPEPRAARILLLETRIARAHAPDADAADVFKQNNPWKRADFAPKAPGIDWKAYFKSAGLAQQQNFIVWQPSAVTGTSALVNSESVEVWKDYLRAHLIEQYASVLPKAVAAEHVAFYETILSESNQIADRHKDAIAATNGALGQAVGQLYTQRYFPPEAKARAEAMVADLITAYRARIANLAWMSPQTKEKALAKLAALKVGVGYPDRWIDYSSLNVVRGDAFGNRSRAEAFNRARELAKLRQASDPGEWRIDPQIVGAVIIFSPNAEDFSAGILQPPYFDSKGDAASNYGSAGAGIAHEISHSFDELGNIYDAQGRLGKWWTAEDLANYHSASAKLVAQYSAYCPFTDLCVNGKQVVNENIADLAGLLTAHDAYVLSLKGKSDVIKDGLSGEQRFFLAFSQRWRKSQGEPALRRQVATDHHPPGQYRSATVRNVEAWYKAYKVAPGDKLYLDTPDRVAIW